MNDESLDSGELIEYEKELEQQTSDVGGLVKQGNNQKGIVHYNFSLLLQYLPQKMIPR